MQDSYLNKKVPIKILKSLACIKASCYELSTSEYRHDLFQFISGAMIIFNAENT